MDFFLFGKVRRFRQPDPHNHKGEFSSYSLNLEIQIQYIILHELKILEKISHLTVAVEKLSNVSDFAKPQHILGHLV